MNSLSCSLVSTTNPGAQFSSGSKLKPLDKFHKRSGCTNLSFAPNCTSGKFIVQAAHSNEGRSSSSSAFIGGFVLGGLIVGTLGCVYAPQISQALAVTGTDKKDLMRKLPKFIYDEEKALEKTRKVLAEKIAQLNSAIDDVSTQIQTEEPPNGAAGYSDEVGAAM